MVRAKSVPRKVIKIFPKEIIKIKPKRLGKVWLNKKQQLFYLNDDYARWGLIDKIQFFKRMGLLSMQETPYIDTIAAAEREWHRITNCQVIIEEKVGNSETVWICPACDTPDNGSAMVACDSCDKWFHFICVGIGKIPGKKDPWICSKCTQLYKSIESKLNSTEIKSERIELLVLKFLRTKPCKRIKFQA